MAKTEPMADERLSAIREREQAATEGPWGTNGSDSPACDVEHAAGFALAYMASGYYRKRGVMEAEQQGVVCQLGTLVADARFMAAARTDVPDLLAEVERLRKELAEKEAEVDDKSEVGHAVGEAWMEEARRYAGNAHYWRERAEQAEAVVKQHEDLLASIALYINWRYVTKQLTTEQKDLFADALERNAFRIHGPDGEEPDPEMAGLPSYAPRWWKTENEDQLKDGDRA